MMRAGISTYVVASALLIASALSGEARAASTNVVASTREAATSDISSQSRVVVRRAPSRVRIYRSYSYPGPNAVRICNAYYEQEYRLSGTVIVPRMHCYWRG